MNVPGPQPSSGLSHLWKRNSLVWLGLVLLLAATFVLAYTPLGWLNGPVSLLIAAAKAGLVVVLFMELSRAHPLIRLTAMMGLVFVTVLFALTSTDVLMRF